MPSAKNSKDCLRIPPWLRTPLPTEKTYGCTSALVREFGLNTVCQSAKCPNKWECFSNNVATFLIMGGVCSRNCRFCNIEPGTMAPLEADEPQRVAAAAKKLGLKHVVITSVTRDDLPDGGSAHFAATIEACRKAVPDCTVEVLIPDFQGDETALETVLRARPDILNHNVETAPELYEAIRPQADYEQSLQLLRRTAAHSSDIPAKSGLMVGLGETDEQVRRVIRDLHHAGSSIITVGQYMRPSRKHPAVQRYVEPQVFDDYAEYGKTLGVKHMFCAPRVRSSYNAALFAE